MPNLTAKQVARYRLSHPQKEAIMIVGGRQVDQTEDEGVAVCESKFNETKRSHYWSGEFTIYDPKKKKDVALRPKTFRTMEKNGLITLAGSLPTENRRWVSSTRLLGRLTGLGWDLFDFLAAERIAKADVWEAAKKLILAEEKTKGDAYRVTLHVHRRVVRVEYQEAYQNLDVVANSPEEAERKGREQLAEALESGEKRWSKNNYPTEDEWPDRTLDGRVQDRDQILEITHAPPAVLEDTPKVKTWSSESLDRRVDRRAANELGRKPPIFTGLQAYVVEGQRPAWIQQKMAEDFGGRLITGMTGTQELDPVEPEDDEQVDADLGRFGGLFDED